MTGPNDNTTVYQSEDDDELSFYQITKKAAMGALEVEEIEGGYLVDGTLSSPKGEGGRDMDPEFVSEEGDVITWKQIGYAMRSEPDKLETSSLLRNRHCSL